MLVHYIDPHFRAAIYNIAPRGRAFQKEFVESIDSLVLNSQRMRIAYLTSSKSRISKSTYCSRRTSLVDLDKLKNLHELVYLGHGQPFMHKCSPSLESITLASMDTTIPLLDRFPKLNKLVLKENQHGLDKISLDTKARIEILEVQHLTNFSDLEGFKNLRMLRITNACNLDLKTLPVLPHCTHLRLEHYRNGLEHISQSLPNVKFIAIPKGRISDLTPLHGFDTLKSLDLSNNCIHDLTALEDISLESLNLSGNMIENAAHLERSKELQYLDLSDNPLISLSPIQGLTSLEFLDLKNTPIINLNAIQNLKQLKEFFCSFTSEMQLNSIIDMLQNMPVLERINNVSKNHAIRGCFDTYQYEKSVM